MAQAEFYRQLAGELTEHNATLVAVSKIQPVEKITKLYELGQRDFGENYVQELVDKSARLPTDIRWHFIGHLQSNKVRQILPVVTLIHGVDSLKLLKEIDKQSQRLDKQTDCLLQVFIADEKTKFGVDESELNEIIHQQLAGLSSVRVRGLMGMASFTDDEQKIDAEFKELRRLFDHHRNYFEKAGEPILSMGMSADYRIALANGSTMVRIGSLLFGARPPKA